MASFARNLLGATPAKAGEAREQAVGTYSALLASEEGDIQHVSLVEVGAPCHFFLSG
jgi:hypothetical protein